jgi:hypothetical protein
MIEQRPAVYTRSTMEPRGGEEGHRTREGRDLLTDAASAPERIIWAYCQARRMHQIDGYARRSR